MSDIDDADLVLPLNLTEIKEGAFEGLKIKSVRLGNKVKRICSQLESYSNSRYSYIYKLNYPLGTDDEYIYADLQVNGGNDIRERMDYSVVKDSQTGDLIIKVVSLLPKASNIKIQLGEEALQGYSTTADLTVLSKENEPDRQREWDVNTTRTLTIGSEFTLDVPNYSVSIIRIKKAKK